MGIHKSYFKKNNTIQFSSVDPNFLEVNTAKNRIAQLFYGQDQFLGRVYSRYLFEINLDDLKNKLDNGIINLNNNTKHVLKMQNTANFDYELLGKFENTGKLRNSSFDLILFRVDEFWDEGVGFEYDAVGPLYADEVTFSTKPSNWKQRVTETDWLTQGVYSGSPSAITITVQHFDNGNENISMDITSSINELLTGNTSGFTFGLAHPYELESSTGVTGTYYVGFYSKYTNTFFEPFLETTYDDVIKDDRNKFCTNKNNNLYLIVTKGGDYVNLDYTPIVEIYDNNDALHEVFSGNSITNVTKGVYKITLNVPSTYDSNINFTDKWTNLYIDGIKLKDKEQFFTVLCDEECYGIGSDDFEPVNYRITCSGIKNGENISRGNVRKIYINALKEFTTKNEILEEVYYRIYINQGTNYQYDVIEWSKASILSNKSFFTVDTSFMIPQKYYIDIKTKVNSEIRIHEKVLDFTIISNVVNNQ